MTAQSREKITPGKKAGRGFAPRHCFAVPAYGNSPYLENCLASLKSQREPGSELILCTSTPSPFLEELARRYGADYYVREGASSLEADWTFALKTAVQEKGASLVTLAHQDDMYDSAYTEELMKAAAAWPDLSVFCTRYRTIDASGNAVSGKAESVKRLLRLPLRLKGCAAGTVIKKAALRFGNSIGCPTCTYHIPMTGTDIFRGNYSFVEDWNALLMLAERPGRFVCCEKELISYRVHQGAATSARIKDHTREKEEREIFEKLWPAPAAACLMHFYQRAYSAYD